MPVGSTPRRSVQVSGFDLYGCLTPTRRLVSASCSSGQRFASGFLQIRSHPRHPCLWLTLPLAGRVEDFHLQVSAPCRAHHKKTRSMSGFFTSGKRLNQQSSAEHQRQPPSRLHPQGLDPSRASAGSCADWFPGRPYWIPLPPLAPLKHRQSRSAG